MKRTLVFALMLIASLLPGTTIGELPERASTVDQRERINLTVYNGGTALVHDRRRLTLEGGLNRLAWRDVSANMDSTSALLETVASSNHVTVVEQNFDFDLLNPQALLQKYVGQYVTVVHDARFPGDRDTKERARVLSTNGGIVLQYRDRIETEVRGHIIYPFSPTNFRAEPTLVLDFDSQQSGPQTLDLSYLTSGLSWHADYVGVLSPDDERMSLRGLVTLSNTSGISYGEAHLQLVAGNVNVVAPPNLAALKTIARMSDIYSVNGSNGVRQENYFEYHLYTLERPTTILNNQTKQVTLLTAHDIAIHKTLELRGSPDYYRSAQPDIGDRLPIGVYMTFQNKGGDLGVPLPAGVVRIYKNDSQGLHQFLGSDQIDHTPRNENVRIHLGDSFDVTARKRQTDFHFLSPGECSTSSSYEITMANAKSKAQDVLVVEPIPADWEIVDENMRHTKSSASTANWAIRVPADGTTTLKYTADVKWCG